MDDTAERVVREFLASWRDMTGDEFARFFSEDGVHADLPLGEQRGRAAIREAAQHFPPINVEVTSLLSTNGRVMVERIDRFELRGTAIELRASGAFEVGDDGLIRRFTDYYDSRSVADQLQAASTAPPPPPPA